MKNIFKNIISTKSQPQSKEKHEQNDNKSDFDRLIQLCNSYGLNQQQTHQLIQQFKKGSYNSKQNSIDQSMMSENNYHQNHQEYQNERRQNKCQRDQQYEQQHNNYYQNPQHNNQIRFNRNNHNVRTSLNDQRLNNNNKHHNQTKYQQYCQEQQQDCHYHNQQQQQQQQQKQSYNQMTFNENQNQNQNQQSKYNDTLMMIQMHLQNTHNNQLQKNINFNSIKALHLPPLRNKHNQFTPNSIIQTKNMLLNQIQNQRKNQIYQNQKNHQINSHKIITKPKLNSSEQQIQFKNQYFKVIKRLQQSLQENSKLQVKNTTYLSQLQNLRIQNQKLKNQNLRINQKLIFQENQKNSLIKSKQADTEIILGLKDTIVNLTKLIKDKDQFNQQLHTQINTLHKKQEQLLISSSNSSLLQRKYSRKGLVTEPDINNEQPIKRNQFQMISDSFKNRIQQKNTYQMNNTYNKKQNEGSIPRKENQKVYPRKQLGELTNLNVNLNPSQSNKYLRNNSTQKINTEKNQVPVQQLTKKQRGSSRVDIKKYKGMIQELRNNYAR